MAFGGYRTLIDLIADGMAVNAATANRPLVELQGNVDYVKDLLESALLGSTVFARNRTVAEETMPGQAVYYNAASQRFEPALAAVVADTEGRLVTSPSSYVWGLIYRKWSATRADVLLQGLAAFDLSAALESGQVLSPGLYYLSAQSAGRLTRNPPALRVPVALVAGQTASSGAGYWEVYVRPDLRDALESHHHYRFELRCILATTGSEEGWLPATHAIFGGKAPAGAVYGYNVGATRWAHLWPPLPPESAYLEWNRGETASVLGTGVPSGNAPGDLVRFDAYGIWWMSDCVEMRPFAPAASLSLSLSAGACPHVLQMKMVLYFSRPSFWSNYESVRSLHATPGLFVRCYGTEDAASTGHLQVGIDLASLVGANDQAGSLAFKSVSGNRLHLGRVVEGIRAGSSNVQLTSDLGSVGANGIAQGVVTISVDTGVEGAELPVQTVRLDGVTEEYHQGVIALGFPAGIACEVRSRLRVPAKAPLPVGTRLKLRFRLLGRAAGTLNTGALTLSVRRIAQPTSLGVPVLLPIGDTSVALPLNVTYTASDQYCDVESDPFDIAAGDVVLFTLARPGMDVYGADLLLLQEYGILVAS